MKFIKSTTVSFSQLNDAQWRDIAGIEAECHITPWSLDSLQAAKDAKHTAMALLIHEQAAGYVVLMHNVDDWELLNITIAPELHRLGLGQQLLSAGLMAARKAGTNSVFLEVRASNLAALKLYERNGFERVGVRKSYYRTNQIDVQEDAIVMRVMCVAS